MGPLAVMDAVSHIAKGDKTIMNEGVIRISSAALHGRDRAVLVPEQKGSDKSAMEREFVSSLLHELTHVVLHTEDHRYGIKDCQDLAKEDIRKSLTNADTWANFIMSFNYQAYLLKTVKMHPTTRSIFEKSMDEKEKNPAEHFPRPFSHTGRIP